MIWGKSAPIFQRLSFLNVANVECDFLVAHKFIVLIYSMNTIWNTRNALLIFSFSQSVLQTSRSDLYMTSGWVFVFKNNQNYVYQINSGILTTLLQFEIFCKIVNMSRIAGWQDLVLLCSNTVGFPDHFSKLHKLPFELLESSGMRRTFCKFQWTKSIAMVNYKEKKIFLLLATTKRYRSSRITIYEVLEISA